MRLHYTILLAVLLLCSLAFLLMPFWTVDDAFIAYRYGKNLVETGEFTWNPGEPAVEGYTGALLPLISALLHLFTDNIVPLIRFISLYCLFGSAILMYRLGRIFDLTKVQSSILVAIFCLCPMVFVHVFSGLETMIFAYLILMVIFQVVRQMERGWPWWGIFVLFLSMITLSITRPEGFIFCGVVLVTLIFAAGTGTRKIAQFKILTLGLFVLTFNLLYCLWKLKTYGDWLPNTYYAKSFSGLFNPESIKAFLRFFGYYLVLPSSGALAIYLTGNQLEKGPRQKQTFILFVALGFSIILVLGYARSQLFMNYASRFFFPLHGPLLLVLGVTTIRGWNQLKENRLERPIQWKRMKHFLIGLTVFQVSIYAFKFYSERQFTKNMDAIMEEEYLPIGEMLKSNLSSRATVISYMDAGAISYHSGLKVIDFGRLNDLYLAREQPDSMAVIDYFYQQDAEAVVFTNRSPDRFDYLDEAFSIQRDPRFRNYKLVGTYGNSRGFPYYQLLYYRKDLMDGFY